MSDGYLNVHAKAHLYHGRYDWVWANTSEPVIRPRVGD